MSLLAGAEEGAGIIMPLLGLSLALVLKFSGFNIPVAEWEERPESAVCLYQDPAQLIMELAINFLEDGARQAVMVLPEEDQTTLEKNRDTTRGPVWRGCDNPRAETSRSHSNDGTLQGYVGTRGVTSSPWLKLTKERFWCSSSIWVQPRSHFPTMPC